MSLSGQKGNVDSTNEQTGQSQNQQQGYGGQYSSGQQGSNSQISYLDPGAIAKQQDYYGAAQGQAAANTNAANASAGGFYSGLLGSGGYSDAAKEAISQTANEAGNEKLAEGRAAMDRHGAATGNSAGFGGATSDLYGGAARDQAARTRENTIAFEHEQQRQKELGGAGMERLLGVNQAAALGNSSQNSNLATLRSGESQSGFHENLGASTNQSNSTGQTSSQGHNATSTSGFGGSDQGGTGDIIGGLLKALGLGGGSKGGSPSGGGGGQSGQGPGGLTGTGTGGAPRWGAGPDANGNNPNSPNYDPYNVPGANDNDPSTQDVVNPDGSVDHISEDGSVWTEGGDMGEGDYGPYGEGDPNYFDDWLMGGGEGYDDSGGDDGYWDEWS